MVRPILFNGEMVRAILEGRKTVTRRVIKGADESMYAGMCGLGPGLFDRNTGLRVKEPYYRLGDILYVRETWNGDWCDHYIYRADGGNAKTAGYSQEPKWRPSIHMPKKAARIWLKVTDVRVERLQDISVPDMIKEGVRAFGCEPCLELNERCKPQTSEDGFCGAEDQAEDMFSDLWDSTTKKFDLAKYGWDANPWVWVIEFERCEKPESCILRGVEPAEEKRPCIGYGDAWADEPCEMCKGCSQCTGNDEEAEGC